MTFGTRNRILVVLRHILKFLIVATIALLVWNHYGMNHQLIVDAKTDHELQSYSDLIEGGASRLFIHRTENSITLDCDILKKYQWPYCSFTRKLGIDSEGVDLSSYDSVELKIAYAGVGPNAVRLYLRNFDEGISKKGEFGSLKVNEVAFEVPPENTIKIPLKIFQVPAWWIDAKNVSLANALQRLDKVVYVEIATGGNAVDGRHRIELKSITFQGKWISRPILLIWIVAAWLLFGITTLVIELLDFRANLIFTKKRVAHLVTVLREKKKQVLEQPSPNTSGSLNDDEELDQATLGIKVVEDHVQQKPARPNYLKWISANVGNSLRVVMIDDIIYFQTENKYTRVVLADYEVLISKSLKELLEELDPEQFWKLHRSIIVNILEVANITPSITGELVVKLKSRREQLPVSDAFIKKFRQSR